MADAPPIPEDRVHDVPEDRLHDPREAEEWFRKLPASEREVFRRRWRNQEVRRGWGDERRRKQWGASIGIAIGFFVLTEWAYAWAGAGPRTGFLERTALALVVGAATGAFWEASRQGRFLYAVSAIPGFLIVRSAVGFGNPFVLFFGAAGFISVAACLGTLREVKRWDGVDL